MSILTLDKFTEIFCIADDFCKEFEKNELKLQLATSDGKKRHNHSYSMSESEMITILIYFRMGCQGKRI